VLDRGRQGEVVCVVVDGPFRRPEALANLALLLPQLLVKHLREGLDVYVGAGGDDMGCTCLQENLCYRF